MLDFNQYDFKRAIINFVQIFLIGYLFIGAGLFTLAASSVSGIEKALNDLSIEIVFDPILWLLPLLFAGIIGPLRGFKEADIDLDDPTALDAYFERQRFTNQPLWFKATFLLLISCLLFRCLSPESEVSMKTIELMRAELVEVHSDVLYQKFDEISADGSITQSEFNRFMMTSLNVQAERFRGISTGSRGKVVHERFHAQ